MSAIWGYLAIRPVLLAAVAIPATLAGGQVAGLPAAAVLAIVAATLASCAAWHFGRAALLRSTDRMFGLPPGTPAAARLATGAPPALRRIAAALDGLAASLQAKSAEAAATHAALARSEEMFRVLTEGSIDVFACLDPGYRRTYVSPACEEVLGYTAENLVGHTPRNLVHPEDWAAVNKLLGSLSEGTPRVQLVYRAVRGDGRIIWLEGLAQRLSTGEIVVTSRDITRRRLAEQQLEAANQQLAQLANLDGLTGLLNRRGFDETLDLEQRRAERLGTPLTLVMIDVDHFKAYNDTYGHPAGDACLRAIARVINRQLRRSGDSAARYGGEEFAVILPGTNQNQALALADSIRLAVEDEGLVHKGSPRGVCTVSMGVASLSPSRTARSSARLLEQADAALYDAKRSGRNTTRAAALAPPDCV